MELPHSGNHEEKAICAMEDAVTEKEIASTEFFSPN
jgi:hypothetical protein